ncbi:MAG: hypothetical protein JXA71_16060 [Chitinispirillaceae bacterium]|nr:hypothetical protein [Chitinispirillaceae bacterium]
MKASHSLLKQPFLHTVLFGIYPVAFLYSHNSANMDFFDTVPPLLCLLALTALLLLIAYAAVKERHTAGMIVSLFFILFFWCGPVIEVAKKWHIASWYFGRIRYLLPFWFLMYGALVYVLYRMKNKTPKAAFILNTSAIAITVLSLAGAGIQLVKRNEIGAITVTTTGPNDPKITTPEHGLPDIYYIILDGYASSATLQNLFDFDNSPFTEMLEDRGFFIASRSFSNYATTFLSLSSSLSMGYVNFLADSLGKDATDETIAYRMIKNSRIANRLRSIGYTVVHFETPYTVTGYNKFADVNIRWKGFAGIGNEFTTALLQMTMFRVLNEHLILPVKRAQLLFAFDRLGRLQDIPGPRFVFAHMICPHPPFVFDREGNQPKNATIRHLWTPRTAYVDQLLFVNDKIEAVIASILERSKRPPVIILQADHGSSSSSREDLSHLDNHTLLRERMRIFNAYHLPGVDHAVLYDSISPVNTFRILCNAYFGTAYPLLDDKSYWSDYLLPYDFAEVTDIVKEPTGMR